ncbi:MAG: YbaB/EbfC family nucleoid-associated protein [Sphingomonadales bacterium]|jgi:DNA-binding YbaB/EbfC family protein
MTNLSEMIQKAQEMQQKIGEIQSNLDDLEVIGEAGAGMIRVILSAKGVMKSISIAPELFDREESEVVEDLIIAAHNEAKSKAEGLQQEEMGKLTSGLPLPPGFKLPF